MHFNKARSIVSQYEKVMAELVPHKKAIAEAEAQCDPSDRELAVVNAIEEIDDDIAQLQSDIENLRKIKDKETANLIKLRKERASKEKVVIALRSKAKNIFNKLAPLQKNIKAARAKLEERSERRNERKKLAEAKSKANEEAQKRRANRTARKPVELSPSSGLKPVSGYRRFLPYKA